MFHVKHDELFSELRSITQRAPSPEHWDELVALLRPLEGDDLARFHAELAPYLQGALSHWPDETRVADDLLDPAHVMSVSRTLLFDERFTSQPHTLTRIKSRSKTWSSTSCEDIRRVDVRYVSKNMGRLFRALMGALSNLTSIHIKGHFENAPDTRSSMKGVPVLTSDFVHLAVDLHGPTLESFLLQETWREPGSKHTPTSRMWDALYARLGDLPNLRALHVRQTNKARKAIQVALAEPRLDGIEELQIDTFMKNLDVSWLTGREASKNLRRVRVVPISDADALALVTAPNLSGVTCWELHEDSRTDTRERGWGSERSLYWASKSPYIDVSSRDLLATRWLELTRLDSDAIHERLFDTSGDLRPSVHAKGICMSHIKYKDSRTFIAQAADAMPNLRVLAFVSGFVARPHDIRALSESPLIDQLDVFYARASYATRAGSYRGGTASDVAANRGAWVAVADDVTIHPGLRAHAWRCATCGDALRDLRSIARAMGMRGYSKLHAEELSALIEARAPDVFDDPRAGVTDADVPEALDPNGTIAWWRANP